MNFPLRDRVTRVATLVAVVLTALLLVLGARAPLPPSLLAFELAGLIALIARWDHARTPITLASIPVAVTTYVGSRGAPVRASEVGWGDALRAAWEHLGVHGLLRLVHADTLLFLGALTLFVTALSQSGLLDEVAVRLVRRTRGSVSKTVMILCALGGALSGILDGVSVVGVLMRTLAATIFLVPARTLAARERLRGGAVTAVILSTVVTTVCGAWLAYGEPPNLIMKANVRSPGEGALLTDGFFITWIGPFALISLAVVLVGLARTLSDLTVDLNTIDMFESQSGVIRHRRASTLGDDRSATEVVLDLADQTPHETRLHDVVERLEAGFSLPAALDDVSVTPDERGRVLTNWLGPEAAARWLTHEERGLSEMLAQWRFRARRAWGFSVAGIGVFALGLLGHSFGWFHAPVALAPLLGAIVVIAGLGRARALHSLILRRTREEFSGYVFLVPLFLLVGLLVEAGFFATPQRWVADHVRSGASITLGLVQFAGCTFLSAVLDNNIVADFASRILVGMPDDTIRYFSLAQIQGYALGGCLTHIGSAQSILAFEYIKRTIRPDYTPSRWVRDMSGFAFTLMLALTAALALAGWLRA